MRLVVQAVHAVVLFGFSLLGIFIFSKVTGLPMQAIAPWWALGILAGEAADRHAVARDTLKTLRGLS